MTLAYDSDSIIAIPIEAEIIAYYNDGESGTATPEQLDRYPNARKYSISRKNGVSSYWRDVESGAGDIPGFITDFKANLVHGIYLQASAIPELESAAVEADISGYDLWAASWGPAELVSGSVWTQYAAPGYGSDGHYDISIVYSGWVPLDGSGSPVIPSNVVTTPKDDAVTVVNFGSGIGLITADGKSFAYSEAATPPEGSPAQNAPLLYMSESDWNRLPKLV